MNSGVYKITNKHNNKCYIGSSSNINQRWYSHKSLLKRKNHPNPHLQNAWNKYGENNFVFDIIEYVDVDNLLHKEQKYLDEAKQNKDIYYNSSFDATKVEMTSEIREKIGNSHRGKFGPLSSHYGIYHSDETKKLIKKNTIKNTPRGNKHPKYNHKVYKFKNKITNDIFIGTQHEFYTKFSLKQSKVNLLVNNIRNSHKGWILVCN